MLRPSPPSPAPRPRPRLRALGLAAAVLALAGCGAVRVPAGPDAADPACADVVVAAPPQMLGQDRAETTSQGTVAWGSGESTIVLRCGVAPPPPTTTACTRLDDGSGRSVDWIVKEEDGLVTFTTYGRSPAVDITVPRAAAPDQPSAVALEMARPIAAIEPTAQCLGPEDAA